MQIEITPNKTYATAENATKAVEKKYPPVVQMAHQLRYIMMRTAEGRYFPLFVGQQSIQAGVHFHFNCVN